MLSRLLVFALELAIVTAAVLLGAEIASQVRIIPTSLLRLPLVGFSAEDTRTVLTANLVACAVAFAGARLVAGWGVFRSARRAAIEVYALVVGAVAAALYLFVFTQINFSPELLLDSTLLAILGFLLSFLIFGPSELGLGRRLGGFVGNLFGLLARPAAWLVVLFALSPIVVAWRFTTDRDFANAITKVRVEANIQDDLPYELVSALGSTRFLTPIMVQFAEGDPGTAYVLTRQGQLWRADYPSGADPELLLDISKKVGYVEMENGALGFDLHPDFGREGSPSAGHVYLYFTEYGEDEQVNRLNRYDLSLPTPEARKESVQQLIAQRRDNDGYHNAGMVEFGPDGMLYIAVGEASMPRCHQRIDCGLVGGVLRIDVDQRGGTVSRPITTQPYRGESANYYIPLDNPYADRPEALGEFWAHGMRNPFRFGFDPATGQMWLGDVGSTVWEEVNRVVPGGNYQFPYIEGREPQRGFKRPPTIEGREVPPVLTYRHTAFLRSVIGGTVYRGRAHPELRGQYVFGDNYSGEIMTIPADAERAEEWEVIARAREVAQRGLTGFTVAPDGAILVPVMGDNDKPTGTISRLVRSDSKEGRMARDSEVAEARRLAAARIPTGTAASEMAGSGVQVAGIPPDQARSLFNVNCARCHGARGRGDGPDAKLLEVAPTNLATAEFQRTRSDRELLAVLVGGGPAVGKSAAMPPWEGVLSEQEMAGMVEYVRSLGPQEGGS